jgi:hypothetical protein
MRPGLSLGWMKSGESPEEFVNRTLRTLEEASYEDAMVIADAYGVTLPANFTPVRTIDPTTASLQVLANFVATFITDLQKRSINRAE